MLWKDFLHSNVSNYPSSSQHQSPLLNGFIILAGLGYFSMQSFKLFSCNNESFLEHLILHAQRNVSVLIYECCWTKYLYLFHVQAVNIRTLWIMIFENSTMGSKVTDCSTENSSEEAGRSKLQQNLWTLWKECSEILKVFLF